MTQATTTTIPIRDHGAPRAAIVPTSSNPNTVRQRHADLIARLVLARPSQIIGARADSADIEHRADHVQDVLHAVAAYVNYVVSDTAETAPLGSIDRKEVEGLLSDVTGDVVGALRRAAERVETSPSIHRRIAS